MTNGRLRYSNEIVVNQLTVPVPINYSNKKRPLPKGVNFIRAININ